MRERKECVTGERAAARLVVVTLQRLDDPFELVADVHLMEEQIWGAGEGEGDGKLQCVHRAQDRYKGWKRHSMTGLNSSLMSICSRNRNGGGDVLFDMSIRRISKLDYTDGGQGEARRKG